MTDQRFSVRNLPYVDPHGHNLTFCVTCISVRPIDIKQAVVVIRGYSLCEDHINLS